MTPASADTARPGVDFTHGSVEVFGHEVTYAARGDGPDTIVLCPGSAGADGSWAKDLLAESMRVIELNPPGWGGHEPLNHQMDQRDLAVILAAAVEHLGIEHYYLHGASMGGVTALWLAALYPDRVRSLTVEGGMNFVEEHHLVSPANARTLAEMVERNDPEGAGYPRAEPHPMKPWADDEYVREQMRKRILMMRMLSNAYQDDLASRLPSLPVPILAVLGDHDEILRPSHLDRWKQIHPAVETLLLAGAAHDIQNTEPRELVAAMRSFWTRHPER